MGKKPEQTATSDALGIPLRASTGRMESLDGLRLIAALAVLCFHYFYRGSVVGGYLDVSFGVDDGVIPLLYLGVNLFFMISGFVIMASAQDRSSWSFGISRVKRLYPAYLATMTLTALIMAAWSAAPFLVTPTQWLANLTMMAPAFGQPFVDGAYWSIVVEIIFYGWVALAILSGVLPRHTDIFAGIWLAIMLIDNLLLQNAIIGRLFLTMYGANFAFGILVYQLHRHGKSPLRLAMTVLALLLSLIGAERERVILLADYGNAHQAIPTAVGQLAVAAIFLTAIGLARIQMDRSNNPGKHRLSPMIATAAGISYPLYLFHQHAGYIIINALSPSLGKWLAVLIATVSVLLVAWLIWRFAEPVGKRHIDRLFGLFERLWRHYIPVIQTPAE